MGIFADASSGLEQKRKQWIFSIDKKLEGRTYTVIAGHTRRYLYATHNEQDYYILGTTVGSNRLRGLAFGETDHLSWVTMTQKGTSLGNFQEGSVVILFFWAMWEDLIWHRKLCILHRKN
ncbi:hypothetical protein [Pedobacter sp. MC2016-24]|uniref:hypothetical protein n=1 Tax=Pedobacter sp. MC2016-24 TaxID=2780090 RepID=UPI001880F2AD|nr:hypothetical protein [Pedobacter sp. MC2016-24]MBE9601553.1 hypothetical protein [Pedobacter sp. MC2016-24]